MGVRRSTRCIGVEGVAYQSTLLFWFEQVCEQEGIHGFEFVELSPKGQNKNNRIKRGLVKLLAGEIYLHPTVRSLVISQIVDWNPLKTNNKDDIIDPIGYVEEMLRDHELEIVRNTFWQVPQEISSGASHTNTLQLPF